jgi:hypothetical protein
MRRGCEKGRCPQCREVEDVILLKCSGTKKWRERFMNSKWLNINEYEAYQKIINCTDVAELRRGKYLYKIRCKWENRISNIQLDVGKGGVELYL